MDVGASYNQLKTLIKQRLSFSKQGVMPSDGLWAQTPVLPWVPCLPTNPPDFGLTKPTHYHDPVFKNLSLLHMFRCVRHPPPKSCWFYFSRKTLI